jgi:hypothetical protein
MLTRIADRSGGGGKGSAAGGNAGCGSGTGWAGGAVAQAAICSASNKKIRRAKSVTEPDTHDIDLRRPEPTTGYVQLVKVINGADINSKVVSIIDSCTLYAGNDALQREFSTPSVRVFVRGK